MDVPDREVDVLIAGAGPAGSACAEALRDGGFGGSVLLVGREPDPPYDRPPLSKGYLGGAQSREECFLYPDDFWDKRSIELLTRTSVMKLDLDARVARLSDKREVAFGKLLLATGSNVRRLRIEGSELEGIHYLRTLGTSDSLRRDAESAERVVLVGGSYIACEVSATLTTLGKTCTLVMLEDAPLSAGFGERAGEFFGGVLHSHGVDWLPGETVARFEGDGRVQRVVTESGRTLDAELVVMGTGAVPDVTLARAAGLELADSGGVVCNARLESSAPDVWAAGDICDYDSVLHGRRMRIEHWEVARSQGKHVAANMLGARRDYEEVPYFWSDLADWVSLEYIGPATAWEREVVRGSFESGEFTLFYLFGDRLAAALSVGRGEDLMEARRLLATHASLGGRVDALADESIGLETI